MKLGFSKTQPETNISFSAVAAAAAVEKRK